MKTRSLLRRELIVFISHNHLLLYIFAATEFCCKDTAFFATLQDVNAIVQTVKNVWCLYSASYIENVQFLFMLTERNIYSECLVILLQIAIENNTYLGTWRNFVWKVGVKNKRMCQLIDTSSCSLLLVHWSSQDIV